MTEFSGMSHANINDLTRIVIGCAMKVHQKLGPGLLESAYKECTAYELIKLGLCIRKEHPVPLIYEKIKLECGYRADLIVENRLLLELKCVDLITDIHRAQVLTYLQLTGLNLGLLINFNVLHLKEGIRRIILT